MALDRQGILSELGSVMNKIQSADCGCMGKLFSNNQNSGAGRQMGAMGSPLPTCGGCRRGCCNGHGFGGGASCAGEPCMGRGCNPPKLYADTYNYLNHNLMQPVVNEVYNDLKSLTPANTIMNNRALANQMGLAQGEGMQGGAAMQGGTVPPNQMQGMGNPMQGMNNGIQDQMGGQRMNYQQMGGQQMVGYQMGDQQMGGQQMGGQSMGGQPMGGQPMGGQPMGGQPMGGQPMGGQPMGGQPMGGQPMGGQPMGGQPMDGQPMGGQQMDYQPMGDQQMSGQPMSGMMNQQSMNPQVAQMMGGMGPDIVKMMSGSGAMRKSQSPPGAGGQVAPGDGMQSQPGQDTQMNQGQYNMHGQQQMQNPITQYVTQHDDNPYAQMPTQNSMQQGNATNPYAQMPAQNSMQQGNATNPYAQMPIQNNMQQSNANAGGGYQMATPNPAGQQMAPTNKDYGQHTLGMKKFHEMFPGVISGNLGFDPMAVALRMNPANEKNLAIETMKNMMMGKGRTGGPDTLAPEAAGSPQVTNQHAAVPQQINQQGIPPSQMISQQGIPLNQNQQGALNTGASQSVVPQQQMYANQVPQQQVYTAVTGSPSMVQQPPQQLQQQYQTIQQQPSAGDPNLAAAMNASNVSLQRTSPGMANPQMQQQQNLTTGYVDPQTTPNHQLIKEPIFPADTSRNQPPPNQKMSNQKFYTQYNTLGQPVEVVPAYLYQPPPFDPNAPQTLSPQPITKLRNDLPKYNVKSTVSKTSLMGSRPAGNTPSRSQLQQVYNQYKGSHSNTQQNIRAQGGTHSDGRLNVPETVAPPQQVPVEKVGGDTAANNQIVYNETPVKGQPMTQMGDVAASMNKPKGDVVPAMESPMKHARLRNGLQDMTYTSYPSSAAWSFHGNNNNPPPLSYRIRSRGY